MPEPAGPGDIETVSAGVEEVVEPHPFLHVLAPAPADHGRDAPVAQAPDRPAHLLGKHGLLGGVHDGCQRAVVVEKHGGLLTFQSPLDVLEIG